MTDPMVHEDLRRALARSRIERAIWDAFFSITIGGAVVALLVAIMVSPLKL